MIGKTLLALLADMGPLAYVVISDGPSGIFFAMTISNSTPL